MSSETSDDIQINLNINNVRKLIDSLLYHSKFNDYTPTETTSDRNDSLSKLYSEIRLLNRKIELESQSNRYYLSQLSDRMVNIERSIIRLIYMMKTRLSSEGNFVKKSQKDNINRGNKQNVDEEKERTTIPFSSKKDSINIEDLDIPVKILESGSAKIRTNGFSVRSDDISIEDYEWENNNLREDDINESLCESCPDIIKGNVSISESEAPSGSSTESLYRENSVYNSDSDDISSVNNDRNSNYFDAEEFKLNNNKKLSNNFEKRSNTESTNMSESRKESINNIEPKEEERLFDTSNKYFETDKFHSGNIKVEFKSTTLCTITHYEESNNSGPNKITEVLYKIINNNDIGEYLLVFEEQGLMKSKLIVRINNNLKFYVYIENEIICEYTKKNQSTNGSKLWTIVFKDNIDAAKFCSLVDSFQCKHC
uniref:RanBD1 domain-containing protein n=1 Tax=Strongyloides venezuelensis TaxID=75913 RepID=A0A0K0FNE9_STRVS